jgi:hypothetical protein
MKWGFSKMRFTVCLAALAATLATATSANAQAVSATDQALAKGTVVQPLTLKRQSDLDFGTVVSTAIAGNVTIDPDTGARTVGGGVVPVPSFPGGRGVFRGAATAGQNVQLTMTVPSALVNQSNPLALITVNSMTFDTCSCTNDTRLIGPSGIFDVGVGGDFAIGINQEAGLYQAQFDVTAVYP